MPQIRDLVHTIKSKDLTPAQIDQGFGEIFLSKDTMMNQLEVQEIVEMSRSVKTPYYSAQIPNTATIVTKVPDGGLEPVFVPTTNKTYQIMAADVINAGTGAVSIDFGLIDANLNFIKLANVNPSAGGQNAIELRNLVCFDSNVYPGFVTVSGTPGDAVVQMAYAEIVQ